MKLHLLRHAKTEKQSVSGKDYDRKLLKKGIQQSNEMLKFLKTNSFKNTILYCSDAQRTRETFQIACSNLEFDEVSFHHELYLASLEDLLQFVWNQNSKKDVFIIGHNEGLSEIASYLSGTHIQLKTCDYVLLQFECDSSDEISIDCGIIQQRYHPEVL